MSILIYAESAEGKFKKVAFELASYAKKVAETLGTTVTALTVNISDVSELSKYGVDKVLKVTNDKLAGFTAKAYADVIKQAAFTLFPSTVTLVQEFKKLEPKIPAIIPGTIPPL